MLPSEKLRVLLFVGAVAAVYVAAASAAVRALGERLRGSPSPGRWRRRARRTVFTVAAAGLLCMAWGRFVEPWRLEVTRVRIESAKLAGATRPIRVVHLSDLHCDPTPRLEGRLPEVIAGLSPDLVVFTGDAINSPEGLPVFRECLVKIARIAPVFAVRGNWDSRFFPGLDRFAGTGARELAGEAVRLEVAGTRLWIAGVAVDEERALPLALSRVPPGDFLLFLYHYPDLAEHAAISRVDLYCAGHTHGGQVALPWYGALVTLSRFDKRFERGLYRLPAGPWLYVNRGIGMEGGPAPRVRFCSRPEVTLIEIAPPGVAR